MDSHTQKQMYYFQVKKCFNSECPFHKKLRGPCDVSSFPDPVPYMDEKNVQHYKEGVDGLEKYLPSKLEDVSKRLHNVPFTPTAQTAKNVGFTLKCTECKKQRLLFAQKKLKSQEVNSLKRILAGIEYICGSILSEYSGDESNKDLLILKAVFVKFIVLNKYRIALLFVRLLEADLYVDVVGTI